MKLADGLQSRGFRKWYERELLQSHAHLLLLFLCSIGLMGSFAAFDAHAPLLDRSIDALAIVLMVAVSLWSLRRYLYLLLHAEQVARQAVCPDCKTYGRLQFIRAAPNNDDVIVRCRKCAHEWTIED